MEDHIRQDILRLLDELGVESISPYPTDDGPADIYLPRLRLFIETKASGYANDPDSPQSRENNETPKEQLERYLFSEIAREKSMLDLDGNFDRRWVGILTDGHVWHAWLYDHHLSAIAREEFRNFRPNSPEDLLQKFGSLIADGPIGKPWIPANPKPIFETDLSELHEIYDALPNYSRNKLETKISLWLEMLRTASMEPENDAVKHRLFVRHSFLVGLARGIVHTLANPKESPNNNKIFGDGFISWTVETTRAQTWATSFLERIHSYEWRRRRGDVLRSLYEQLIDPQDRKIFGEYYTPEWLAEWLVEETLDDEWCTDSVEATLAADQGQRDLNGIGVLDPTCGSGTFLYYAARRILRTPQLADLSSSRKASIVARLVNGIDVHPVAAEVSRATLLRALPAEPLDEKAALRIYEGDALLILQDDEQSLFYPSNGEVRVLTPKGTAIFLPRSFVDHPAFTENLRRMILAATNGLKLPPDIQDSLPESDRNLIHECHQKFIDIISKEGNSVWTWFISNTAGPYRLAQQKVNRIVANPPWVRMSDIQVENRKRTLERFAKDSMDIWVGGKQAPHFDIAQLFIKRARLLYLSNPKNDPAAWIVKKSAMKAGNWGKFREWHKNYLAQTIDLENVQVFGPGDAKRCCVLFDLRKVSTITPKNSLRVIGRCKSTRPSAEMSLSEALKLLSFEAMPDDLPIGVSEYSNTRDQRFFRQGATIVPKVLLIVKKTANPKLGGTPARETQAEVTTVKSTHAPWNTIQPQTGVIPKHWIRNLLTSQNFVPFAVSTVLPVAIIPTDYDGKLHQDPSNASSFWIQLNTIYGEYLPKGTNTPKTLLSRIDYAGELSSQLANSPQRLDGDDCSVVLYPTSGDIMRASRYLSSAAIVDSSVYRWTATSADEAAYLVAILNAKCLRRAFVEARGSGRHFHLHPWRKIPIHRFDPKNPVHQNLVSICRQAEHSVQLLMESGFNNRCSQVAQSKHIRLHLDKAGVLDQLDVLVQKILPEQAVTPSI